MHVREGMIMNTANLQLEGLLMAIAAINRILVDKGLLSRAEIERALAICEANAVGEDRAMEELSPANRDAIVFPIRLLRAANAQGAQVTFSALAKGVGQNKGRYNDQQ
jgi:hypothetical protein